MRVFKLLGLATLLPSLATAVTEWQGFGGSYLNNHWAADNTELNSTNIASLSVHCKIPDSAGQSAPPTIKGAIAYYPTHNGSFIALNYETCQVQWNINVTQILVDFAPMTALQLIANSPMARTSPQIDTASGVIYFGTQIHALLVAADLKTGAILGITQVNPHQLATITASLTLYNGTVFVGVSSGEENAAFFTGGAYPCCSFVGNAAAFRFTRNGAKGSFTTLWNVTTVPTYLPTPKGEFQWSGAGIWGSQPSIDVARNQVFFATGNIYSVPQDYFYCTNSTDPHCYPSYIWQESVFALDVATGRANWVRRINRLDAWSLVCGTTGIPRNSTLCPQTPGTDADFGMAPAIIKGSASGNGGYTPGGKDVLTLGQKSGMLYGLAADTGAVLWSVLTSPAAALGGISWGVAADEKSVYYTGVNYAQEEWLLQPGNTTSVNGSIFGAASAKDGTPLWQIPVPNGDMSVITPLLVGDLVLTGSTGPFGISSPGPGSLIAIKKNTGKIVWSYDLAAVFQGVPSVQGKYVFVGTGYKGGTGGAFWVFKAT